MIENTSFVTTKISRKMKHLSSSTTLIVVNSVSHYWAYVHTTKLGQNHVCTLIYISMIFKSKDPHCRLVTKFQLHKNWCAFERLPTSMKEVRSVTRVAYHRA